MRNARPMKTIMEYLLCSIAVGVLVAAIQFGTDPSGVLGFLGLLIVPGYLPAALFFPEGFHSGSPGSFIALIAIFNGLIYGAPVLLFWRWARRHRWRQRHDSSR